MKKTISFLLGLTGICSCINEGTTTPQNDDDFNEVIAVTEESRERKTDFLITSSIFTVSYNEVYEQPNWIEYEVRDIIKVADREGMRFYEVDSVFTSDDDDYYDNVWDRGHLAPAGSFTDSYENLYATFSFLNCTLQKDQLNRGEWNQLEMQARDWAASLGTLQVRVELHFDDGHLVLPTKAHIPSAYTKKISFPDGTMRCFYFPNADTTQDWQDYEVDCN